MPKIINPASKVHGEELMKLAEFLDVDSIEYIDKGNGEDYILTKNGKRIELHVRGNRFDGGYMRAV